MNDWIYWALPKACRKRQLKDVYFLVLKAFWNACVKENLQKFHESADYEKLHIDFKISLQPNKLILISMNFKKYVGILAKSGA